MEENYYAKYRLANEWQGREVGILHGLGLWKGVMNYMEDFKRYIKSIGCGRWE